MQEEPWEPELLVVASNNENYNDIDNGDHDDDNDRYCRKCNKWYTRRRDRVRHILYSKAHKNKPRYECPICGKLYYRKDILKKHLGSKRCIGRFFKFVEEAEMIIPITYDKKNQNM